MQHRTRTSLRSLAIIAAVALLSSGCGGGDAAAPAAAPTPTPADTGADGSTVADGETPAGEGAPSATVPELSGGNISGGSLSGSGGGFLNAQASKVDPNATQTEGSSGSDSELGDEGLATEPVTKPEAPKFAGAVLSVDGVTYSVTLNDTFPTNDPVFRLVGVRGKDVEVELVAGEFTSNGGGGLFLTKGDLVSLVNATEQTTYKVRFVRTLASTSGMDLSSDAGFDDEDDDGSTESDEESDDQGSDDEE